MRGARASEECERSVSKRRVLPGLGLGFRVRVRVSVRVRLRVRVRVRVVFFL